MMFRDLDPAEERRFRRWARLHHCAGDAIDPLWHPAVRDEARMMNKERAVRMAEVRRMGPMERKATRHARSRELEAATRRRLEELA